MKRAIPAILAVVSAALIWSSVFARPTATAEGVLFTFDAPGAERVTIAGEFNSWAPARDQMARAEGSTWRIVLPLKPGRYEYKFVVDGKDWRADSDNPLSVPDPYGGRNSFIVVRADGSLDFPGEGQGEGSAGAAAGAGAAGGVGSAVAPIVASLPALPKPLHLAILWHQHQPRYFKDPASGEYLEPWVRIHGIKDYYDMVAILERYPDITFTVNLTPVLLVQLEEMIEAYSKWAARPHEPGKPGLIPGCDRWVRLTLTAPELLTEEEKILLLKNFFRMPRETMINPYPRFRELADRKQGDSDEALRRTLATYTDADWRDLQAWFNLAEFDPDFREGDVTLPDGSTASVAGLVAKGRGFTEADRAEIVATQFRILASIIPEHKRLQDAGRIEVITSPFYHPILPLLCDTDVAREASPGLDLPGVRFAHPEDARAQVALACATYQRLLGRPPRGLWPSEGSVSEAMLPIVAEAGIDWIASDEGVLARSLGRAALGPEDKYRMYYAGRDGARVGIIFRDHKLSDEIGFKYSKIGGVEAANDLIKKLYDIHRATQDLQGEYVVPIIMDGENAWEQFARDGKDFFHSLYSQVSAAPWLKTVTISEYFDGLAPSASLDHLAPGSWITPDFNTWIGEPEENKAWDYLALARAAAETKLPGLSAEAGQAVMERIHIAEGSDWFWWYGLDQGSGNDESFDEAFRGTLGEVYTLIGMRSPEYLVFPIVGTPAVQPATEIRGRVAPVADGVTGPAEWAEAAYVSRGGDLLAGLAYGYGESDLWLRLDPARPIDDLAAATCRLVVYLSSADDIAAHAYADAPQSGEGHYFGFGISSKIEIDLGPEFAAASWVSDGQGGWKGRAPLLVGVRDVVEIAVPFAHLGLKTGDELRFGVVGYRKGEQAEVLPAAGFLALKVPPLGRMVSLCELDDPRGDDHGPGGYTYPTDPVFVPGAFDVVAVEAMVDPEANVIFKVTIDGQVTGPWGGVTGYCLQAIDIYIDTDGVADSGRRDLFKGRQARTTAGSAWEYFVRASMDSVAIYDASVARLDDVKVTSYADPATKSIFVKFPRSAVASGAARASSGAGGETWNVIVALLSHDGYAEGGVRPVTAIRGQWVLGGCDREDLCPRIIDLVVDGKTTQEAILSSYRQTGARPELPGIKVVLP
jgi:alpha-amylase/alpha-mannosidase (GH57 family)